MAVTFIVDSAADILPAEAKEMGIVHLPLKVQFGEREYRDGVDLSHRAFYEKLVESDEMPTTCQINPAEFEEAIARVRAAGDEAVIITLSSKLPVITIGCAIGTHAGPGAVAVAFFQND